MGASLRILLLEDEREYAQLISIWLTGSHPQTFEVEWEPTLSAGLTRLRVTHYDAAILDLGLPDAAGATIIEQVLATAPGLAVVVVSGMADDGTVFDALKRGAQDYLIKGDSVRHLIARTLIYAIDRKRAEDEIVHFSHRILATREEEKRAVASALHHEVGSVAVGLGSRLDALEGAIRHADTAAALEASAEMRAMLDESIRRLKDLAFDIRPPDLDILGLPMALESYVSRTAKRTAVRTDIVIEENLSIPVGPMATALFRIAQESLTNAVKHAGAESVRLHLAASGERVTLSITDDGCGFDQDAVSHRTRQGLGLRAMQEMAIANGGRLSVESGPGKGTTVSVSLPNAPASTAIAENGN